MPSGSAPLHEPPLARSARCCPPPVSPAPIASRFAGGSTGVALWRGLYRVRNENEWIVSAVTEWDWEYPRGGGRGGGLEGLMASDLSVLPAAEINTGLQQQYQKESGAVQGAAAGAAGGVRGVGDSTGKKKNDAVSQASRLKDQSLVQSEDVSVWKQGMEACVSGELQGKGASRGCGGGSTCSSGDGEADGSTDMDGSCSSEEEGDHAIDQLFVELMSEDIHEAGSAAEGMQEGMDLMPVLLGIRGIAASPAEAPRVIAL